eukprot:Pgem_evm1s2307
MGIYDCDASMTGNSAVEKVCNCTVSLVDDVYVMAESDVSEGQYTHNYDLILMDLEMP